MLNYNNINAEMIVLFGLKDTLFCIQHLSCLVTWVVWLQGLFGCNLPIQFDIQIILFMVIKMTEFFNVLNIIIIYIIQLNSLMNGLLATKVVEP